MQRTIGSERRDAPDAISERQIIFLAAAMTAAAAGVVYAYNRNRQRFRNDPRNIDRRWDRPDRLADTRHEDRRWERERRAAGRREGLRSHAEGFAV